MFYLLFSDNTLVSLNTESRLEGWLSLPNKQNIKRHGWKRQYVVVSSRKIIFYNCEEDKQNSDPCLILDLSKLFHVRSVTQGDVIRADARDIPRIFQVSNRPTELSRFILFMNNLNIFLISKFLCFYNN